MADFAKEFGSCHGPLDFPMTDDGARKLEQLLDTGEYDPVRKSTTSFECFLPGENADISVVSSEEVDREGELIYADSLDWSEFQKNPVVAFNHNYKIPPVGKSLWQKKVNKSWKAKTQYSRRPKTHPADKEWFPESIFHLIKEQMLPGKSIGALCKRREPTVEEKTTYPGVRKVVEKAFIFEYSVVPIGMNKSAVTEAISKGDLTVPLELFPEVADALEELRKSMKSDKPEIVIKSFVRAEDYLRRRKIMTQQKANELLETVPNLIEQAIKKRMGKIQ